MQLHPGDIVALKKRGFKILADWIAEWYELENELEILLGQPGCALRQLPACQNRDNDHLGCFFPMTRAGFECTSDFDRTEFDANAATCFRKRTRPTIMYEEQNDKSIRRRSFRLFGDLPWALRIFLNLFLLVLSAIAIFGIAGHSLNIEILTRTAEILIGFLQLIVGAIVGVLTSEGRRLHQRVEDVPGEDSKL
tara:strand:- start:24586 stop:25167 length:582 start_codon:yes stop_codon:yes gene_type:complete